MSQATSADYAPKAPPAALPPITSHGRDESLGKSVVITVGLVFLVTAFVVLLAVAAFLAVFVVLSAVAPT